MIIIIDGTSGSGKSRIGRRLASDHNLPFIDTGILFRAVTYYAVKHNIAPSNYKFIIQAFEDNKIRFSFDKEVIVEIDNLKIDKSLLHDEINISPLVPTYAHIIGLRDKMIEIERELGKNGSVAVGRNLGNEVFPDAEIKFFVDTSPSIRVLRRLDDMQNKISKQELLVDLISRDFKDVTSDITPLFLCEDHIIVDNSGDFEKVIEFCNKIIEERK